ncbi:MAG: hypothetical protein II875_10575 [Clostridia bacterium]|nr:hypothetical protein [Clostridia bacterium]
MSRKNRNARHQSARPLNIRGIQMSMPGTNPEPQKKLHMVDEKCGYEFTRLSSIALESDVSYQRPIDAKRVARIVENFDARLVNPLKVSNRDGHFYVFDGAHTLAALKEVSKFENFMVPCMVFHGLTYEDEAYLFALQRGESKEVATAMRIRALILSGDPKAEDFRWRTEDAGFKLSASHSAAASTFACIEKLWRIYEIDPELYSDALTLLMACWHGEKWSLAANIIGGVSVFLRAYGKEYNLNRFLKKVGAADQAALNKNKADDPRKDYCYAYAMYKLYNKGGGKGSLEPYALYEYKG